MYGSLKLGESIKVAGYKLSFADGDPPRYVRDGVETYVVGMDHLNIHPSPPIYLPVLGLFRHIMIPIKPSVTVAPYSELRIERSVLVDLAVSTPTEEVEYIDIFPVRTPKMAVYGRTADGILCRYLFEGDGPASVKVVFNVRSDCRYPVTLSKLVMPTSLFRIFYREGGYDAVATELNVTLECDVAVIKPGDVPKGYKPIPLETEQTILNRMQIEPRLLRMVLTHAEEFIMDRGY